MKKTWLVIPTIRTLNFLKAWGDEFQAVDIIVIEDSARKTVKIPKIPCRSITHYCHADIERDLGKRSWIFPWKSAAVRSYGFYKAWQAGAEIIMTLDDDCFPDTPDFVAQHAQNLSASLPTDWTPTYPFRDEMFTRGFPYLVRDKIEVHLSHGLWSVVPDFDGMTQLMRNGKIYPQLPPILHIIPKKMYYPMSAMNVAFRADIAPLMYQLLMGFDKNGKKYDYDRFDDIWCGIFAKKILDHLGFGVVSGTPFVKHERASNVFNNIKKEATGIEKNELLWKAVKRVKLKDKTVIGAYRELIEKVEFPNEPYFKDLKKATLAWLKLFTLR